MSELSKMALSAQNAMVHVMGLKPEDRVLVVTDEKCRELGEAFCEAASAYGCMDRIFFLRGEERPMKEPLPPMLDALKEIDVVINVFDARKEETPFRVKWISKITEKKTIRLGHCPGLTKAMMTEGPMHVDYARMLASARNLMKRLEGADMAHITAPGGTDLRVGIKGRGFRTDVRITEDNPGNLPCGEIWCGPEEDRADGVLVIDGSIGDLGNVSSPLEITLKEGRIVKVESTDAVMVKEVNRLVSVDAEASVIGELGIGLNPGAKLTGFLLEDEKALHTAHIAFGNNEDMPGGRNRSSTHRDFLFNRPTMDVTFEDGSVKRIMEDGVLSG